MINKKEIKILFLIVSTLTSVLSLYLGFRGATHIFSSINPEDITNSTKIPQPFESKVASYLNILVGIVVFVYIIIFKEKKKNIFWLILGPIGIILFSVRKLIHLTKNGVNIAV